MPHEQGLLAAAFGAEQDRSLSLEDVAGRLSWHENLFLRHLEAELAALGWFDWQMEQERTGFFCSPCAALRWGCSWPPSAHLKQEISLEDYRELFESRWRDRASSAGWGVSFSYEGSECVLHLRLQEKG